MYIVKLVGLILMLTYISIKDIKTLEIPDKVLLMGSVYAVITALIDMLISKVSLVDEMMNKGKELLIIVAILFIIALIAKENIGMGDMKLMLVLSLYMSISDLLTVACVSILLSGMFSLLVIITRRKKRNDAVAFAPFISMGVVISIFL